jgi:ATP-binding cassette subfamily C (CFTR/MRP) protein 1
LAVANTFVAEYLDYADKVLIVANGRVKDGGRDERAVIKELMHALKLSDKAATVPKREHEEPNVTSKAAHISEANDVNELLNPTSDLSVYRYYLNSIGWPKMALFVAFVAMDVFCSSFSSKSPSHSITRIAADKSKVIWLKWWAETDGGQITLHMSVYIGLAVLTSLGTGGYVW